MKRCTTSGKLKFKTKGDALVKALRVSSSPVSKGKGGTYRCPHCGFWHLTSKVRSKARTEARIDAATGEGRR